MKIESSASPEERARWKAVRTDSYADVPGEMVSADETTGECAVKDASGETRKLSLGPHGLKIIRRAR